MTFIEHRTQEFASLENFELAFMRISRSMRLEVKDWLALQVYAWPEYKERHLYALISDIWNYNPSAAYNFYNPKQDHSLRRFAFLTIDDRIVYQALGNCIIQQTYETIKHLFDQRRIFANIPTPPSEQNEFVFHRPFTSTHRHANKSKVGLYDLFRMEVVNARENIFSVSDMPWLIKTDISNFYDDISHKVLEKILTQRGWLSDRRLGDLLLKCLSRWQETEYAKGIPIGYETSDYLANLFLVAVDEALEEFEVKRYVDDIYIFAPSYQDVKRALARLDIVLKDLGLRRNVAKTELIYLRDMSKEALLDKIGRTLSFLDQRERRGKAEGTRQRLLYKFFWSNYQVGDGSFCDKNFADIRKVAFALYRLRVPDTNIRNGALCILEHYPNYAIQALKYLETNFSSDSVVNQQLREYVQREYESNHLRFLCLATLAETGGFLEATDILLNVLKQETDWFIKYSLLRSVLEKNLNHIESDLLYWLIKNETNPVVRAYAFWLTARYFSEDESKIRDLINDALQDENAFIKKLGMYMSRYFSVSDVRLTFLPAVLRDQFLDDTMRSEIEDFHALFKQLFKIHLDPDFPIERVFGTLRRAISTLRTIWGTQDQGIEQFVENMHRFVLHFLNSVVIVENPQHKPIRNYPQLRDSWFPNSISVDNLRNLESYWDDLKRGKRLSNRGQKPVLETVTIVLHEYLQVLSKHYLGAVMRTEIFICYSKKDEEWRERVKVHLKPYTRHTPITVWDDTRVKVGSDWDQDIKDALQRAKVAILLVSADFMASDYIENDELPHIFRASETDGLIIAWIAIKPTEAWKSMALKNVQCAHANPDLSLYERLDHEKEKALAEVAMKISELLDAS